MNKAQGWVMNTIAVTLAIVMAYGVQKMIVVFSDTADAVANVVFAITLPLCLLFLQMVIRWLTKQATTDNILMVLRPTKLNAETIVTLKKFYQQLLQQFTAQWEVKDYYLAVFDWQRNVYLPLPDQTKSVHFVIPQHHTLVRYLKQFQTIYFTERPLPQLDELSDTALIEINTFMKRHHFVLALPLATATDVYGVAFFTLAQVKDTKLFAAARFNDFVQFGQQFGGLLQRILIYDAIVLGKQKQV